jgi:7-keto-8-aminopelargonate synthetase-like enzyme
MDGLVAPLIKFCDLADKYDFSNEADECHAAGFIGALVKERLKQRRNGTDELIITGN